MGPRGPCCVGVEWRKVRVCPKIERCQSAQYTLFCFVICWVCATQRSLGKRMSVSQSAKPPKSTDALIDELFPAVATEKPTSTLVAKGGGPLRPPSSFDCDEDNVLAPVVRPAMSSSPSIASTPGAKAKHDWDAEDDDGSKGATSSKATISAAAGATSSPAREAPSRRAGVTARSPPQLPTIPSTGLVTRCPMWQCTLSAQPTAGCPYIRCQHCDHVVVRKVGVAFAGLFATEPLQRKASFSKTGNSVPPPPQDAVEGAAVGGGGLSLRKLITDGVASQGQEISRHADAMYVQVRNHYPDWTAFDPAALVSIAATTQSGCDVPFVVASYFCQCSWLTQCAAREKTRADGRSPLVSVLSRCVELARTASSNLSGQAIIALSAPSRKAASFDSDDDDDAKTAPPSAAPATATSPAVPSSPPPPPTGSSPTVAAAFKDAADPLSIKASPIGSMGLPGGDASLGAVGHARAVRLTLLLTVSPSVGGAGSLDASALLAELNSAVSSSPSTSPLPSPSRFTPILVSSCDASQLRWQCCGHPLA